ncbi:MAG: hypothetical protein GX307_00010 [Euryarchaeota archaeon]|nr:hypothetical protein [Euryarchaeota archaeon]
MLALIGKLELIGEWTDGRLELTEERRMLDMDMLNEIITSKIYETDLQFLLAGLVTTLGIHCEDDIPRYALEVHFPLSCGEGEEYDINVLEQRIRALKELKNQGFYLVGDRGGSVKCYKEGATDDLEDELASIEAVLAE